MSRACVFVSWDQSPHISAEQKEAILAGIPPWQRQARTTGVPMVGEGAIWAMVPIEDITEAPQQIPPHWARCFSLDVGWKRNAALFLAWDRDTDTVHVYDEIYLGNSEPAIVATAIKRRGEWMPGVIDPAARGRSQKDGTRLWDIYRKEHDLDIYKAVNQVEAGLYAVWERLATGRLKVSSICKNFIAEYRLYRRDKKGEVVKENDHLMDCLRYGIMSGLDRAIVEPPNYLKGDWWNRHIPSVWSG